MKIVDQIREETILPELKSRDKLAVLGELADHLALHAHGVARDDIYRVLVERERLASTAIGEGVAIPHGKLDVGKLLACVGRSRAGIDFDSMDGRPTHLFFVLVAPESSTGAHLKALARISRLLKDPEFRARLLAAAGAHEMYQLIADEDSKF
jgi:PTS system nitrogen regulatory IIA component